MGGAGLAQVLVQGWPSGERARLPPVWPGFKSRRRRHMWIEFVVGSLLYSERFFSGFSLLLVNQHFQFKLDQESGRQRNVCGCATSKSFVFILFCRFCIFLCSVPYNVQCCYRLNKSCHLIYQQKRSCDLPARSFPALSAVINLVPRVFSSPSQERRPWEQS